MFLLDKELTYVERQYVLERRLAYIRTLVRDGQFEVAKCMLNQWEELDKEEGKDGGREGS
ncbi:MAG: hypothetical protein MJA29_00280 [Candidatus Omnitrophica bacterium]|nr:hypothetical protein [Candidatus Omnitrophota bacterium]